jgi:cyclophilin family peptidyl-prolyl cis-trans isomerase
MAPKYNRKKQATHKSNANKGSSKQWYIVTAVLAIVVIIAGTYFIGGFGTNNTDPQTSPTVTPNPTPATKNTKVLLQTDQGDIILQLFDDKPITTQNFLKLVALGKYDGAVFHRILKDFMIQSGTINKKGGVIDQNWMSINDEIGSNNHNYQYTIAMAKTQDANSATSGFFINTVDNSEIVYADGTKFDDTYTAFGIVIEGQDIVDVIAKTPVTTSSIYNGERSQPTQTITIISAKIIS